MSCAVSRNLVGHAKPVLRLFGRPRVRLPANESCMLPRKAYPLLALLCSRPDAPMARDYIRHMLWSADAPGKRAGSLRQLIARIQGALPPDQPSVIRIGAADLAVNDEDWAIDLIDLWQEPEDVVGADDWLFSGDLLEGVEAPTPEFDEWLILERQRIQTRREAILSRALLRPEPLRPADGIVVARRLLDIDPTSELGYRTIMHAEARTGNLDAARKTYERCRQEVHAELGVDVEKTTHDLARSFRFSESRSDLSDASPDGIPRVVLIPIESPANRSLMDLVGRLALEDLVVGLSLHGEFRVATHPLGSDPAHADRDSHGAALSAPPHFSDYRVYLSLKGTVAAPRLTLRLTRSCDMEVIWSAEAPLAADGSGRASEICLQALSARLVANIERSELDAVGDPASTAFRLYLEGKRAMERSDLPSIRHARKCFKASLRRAPHFSAARCGLSRAFTAEWLVRGLKDSELLTEALGLARAACAEKPDSARAWREIGFVSLYRHRLDESLDFMRRAHEANPNDPNVMIDYADALLHSGELDRALACNRAARVLDPFPSYYAHWNLGSIHFLREEYDEALEALTDVTSLPVTARLLAAIHAMRGDSGEARRYAATVMENFPDFRVEDAVQRIPTRRPEPMRLFAAALRRSGLP